MFRNAWADIYRDPATLVKVFTAVDCDSSVAMLTPATTPQRGDPTLNDWAVGETINFAPWLIPANFASLTSMTMRFIWVRAAGDVGNNYRYAFDLRWKTMLPTGFLMGGVADNVSADVQLVAADGPPGTQLIADNTLSPVTFAVGAQTVVGSFTQFSLQRDAPAAGGPPANGPGFVTLEVAYSINDEDE